MESKPPIHTVRRSCARIGVAFSHVPRKRSVLRVRPGHTGTDERCEKGTVERPVSSFRDNRVRAWLPFVRNSVSGPTGRTGEPDRVPNPASASCGRPGLPIADTLISGDERCVAPLGTSEIGTREGNTGQRVGTRTQTYSYLDLTTAGDILCCAVKVGDSKRKETPSTPPQEHTGYCRP